jgi:PAS domain S-box-containing protein
MTERVIDFISCLILIYDEEKDTFKTEFSVRLSSNLGNKIHLLINEGLINWAAKKRTPIVIPDKDFKGNEEPNEKYGSFIIVPLKARNKLLAAIIIESDKKEGDFRSQDLELLEIMASQAAIALNNAYLYEAMDEKNRYLDYMQRYMTDVYESMTTGLIVIDMKGKITTFSKPAEKLIGINSFEALNKHYKQIFSKRMSARLDNLVIDSLADGKAVDFDIDNSITGLTGVPIGFNTSLLMDEKSIVNGIIIMCHDLSQTRELEELKKIDRIKSELISNVSHELRTPLSSIKAYTETLIEIENSDDDDVETRREFLNVISAEADRLTKLIDNILNLSKIEAGKIDIEMVEVDLKILIEKASSLVRTWAMEKNIIISHDFMTEKIIVIGEAEMISQILINLLSNSIKYNSNGGKVKIRAYEKNEKVVFEISDNGFGIPEKDLPRIFEKFYRVDTSLTYEQSGTGLGLSIVKKLIEALNAQIAVDSKIGEGTTFTIFFQKGITNNDEK